MVEMCIKGVYTVGAWIVLIQGSGFRQGLWPVCRSEAQCKIQWVTLVSRLYALLVVSCIGSLTYRLAKRTCQNPDPLLGQTKYTVMNSTKFVERLQEAHTEPEDLLVSFDVTSLFRQVPIDEALEVVKVRLNKDPTLVNRTSIPVPQLVELIELCLRSTYFQFQSDFFEQFDGTPMGSPLSPIIAKLFMKDLEEQALHSAPFQPSLWLRYVEDIFVIWPYGEWDMLSFHAHLS